MTRSSGGQPDQHRKCRFCSRQPCSHNAERWLGYCALCFRRRDVMVKSDCLWWVIEIVIGGFPMVLEVHYMCLFRSICRILLKGYGYTHLFDIMRHQVDLWKFEVGIQLLGNINLVADIDLPSVHFAPCLSRFQVSSFVSLSTFRYFTSSVIKAMAWAFSSLPAWQSEKSS